MSNDLWAGSWFAVGMIYTLINIFIRKMYVDNDDMMLPIMWVLAWPICFAGLITIGISKLWHKYLVKI